MLIYRALKEISRFTDEVAAGIIFRKWIVMDLRIGGIMKSYRSRRVMPQSLHKQGIENNTLVFFASDNGGYLNYNGQVWPEVGSEPGFTQTRMNYYHQI